MGSTLAFVNVSSSKPIANITQTLILEFKDLPDLASKYILMWLVNIECLPSFINNVDRLGMGMSTRLGNWLQTWDIDIWDIDIWENDRWDIDIYLRSWSNPFGPIVSYNFVWHLLLCKIFFNSISYCSLLFLCGISLVVGDKKVFSNHNVFFPSSSCKNPIS